jgi:hypothetical protein
VIGLDVLLDDASQVERRDGSDLADRYSLMYQITRLARERDCLTHDDRVEGLSGAVRMFLDHLGLSPQDQADEEAERRLEEWLEEMERQADDMRGESRQRGPKLRGKLRSGSARRR